MMNKKRGEANMKKIINDLVNSYLILKCLPFIIIIIALLTVGYFKIAKPIYEENKKNGYGIFETAKIDPMTGEVIPKSQIDTYNNSNKTIIDARGKETNLFYISKMRDSICDYLNEGITSDNKGLITGGCQLLLQDTLGVDFEIIGNELYVNNMWISGPNDFRDTVNTIVKQIYRKQNGLSL